MVNLKPCLISSAIGFLRAIWERAVARRSHFGDLLVMLCYIFIEPILKHFVNVFFNAVAIATGNSQNKAKGQMRLYRNNVLCPSVIHASLIHMVKSRCKLQYVRLVSLVIWPD